MLRLILFVLVLVLLSGCGGGGSSSGSGGVGVVPPAPPATHNVGGLFAMAPVDGAQCSLYELGSITDVALLPAPVATNTSDAGRVTFSGVTFTGAGLIECSGGVYNDEATLGIDLTVAPDGMRAVVEVVADGAYVVSLVTHLAAHLAGDDLSRALGADGTNAELADQLGLDGVDITTAEPTDLNEVEASDDASGQYGLILAVLSQMQMDASADGNAFVAMLTSELDGDGLDTEAINQGLVDFTEGQSEAAANARGEDGPQVASALGTGTDNTISVTGVEIVGSERVTVGNEVTLQAMVSPSNASDSVVWASSAPLVASVDAGVVRAHEAGVVTITATAGDVVVEHLLTVTEEDTSPPELTLLGPNPVNLVVGTPFADPGAEGLDDVDGLVGVVVRGVVDSQALGAYTLTYEASDNAGNAATEISRTVNVVLPADGVAPTITLLGGSEITMERGVSYVDAGATASDDRDGDVTSDLVVTGVVDTEELGTYTLVFRVSDSGGNVAEASRTVEVVDTTAPEAVASPEGGTYGPDLQVTMTTDADAVVYYTTDGQEPTLSSLRYLCPIAIAGTATLRFVAIDGSGNASVVQAEHYVIDDVAPVITLIGEAEMEIELGDGFVDPGASALDELDGDVSGAIEVNGVVDTETLGTYLLSYSVADQFGNEAQDKVRTVRVVKRTQSGFGFALESVDRSFGAEPFTETASGGQGSGAIQYASDDTAVATVHAGQVTINGVGTATVSASKAEDEIYLGAAASYLLTVRDTTAPVLAAHPDIVLGLNQNVHDGSEHVIVPELNTLAQDDWSENLQFRIANFAQIPAGFGVSLGMDDAGSANYALSRPNGNDVHIHPQTDFSGSTTIVLQAADEAGNESEVVQFNLTIDGEVPVTEVSPTGGSYGVPQQIALDAGVGVPVFLYHRWHDADRRLSSRC